MKEAFACSSVLYRGYCLVLSAAWNNCQATSNLQAEEFATSLACSTLVLTPEQHTFASSSWQLESAGSFFDRVCRGMQQQGKKPCQHLKQHLVTVAPHGEQIQRLIYFGNSRFLRLFEQARWLEDLGEQSFQLDSLNQGLGLCWGPDFDFNSCCDSGGYPPHACFDLLHRRSICCAADPMLFFNGSLLAEYMEAIPTYWWGRDSFNASTLQHREASATSMIDILTRVNHQMYVSTKLGSPAAESDSILSKFWSLWNSSQELLHQILRKAPHLTPVVSSVSDEFDILFGSRRSVELKPHELVSFIRGVMETAVGQVDVVTVHTLCETQGRALPPFSFEGSRGGKRYEVLTSILDDLRKKHLREQQLRAVEVGVHLGITAGFLLRHIPDLQLIGVDPYEHTPENYKFLQENVLIPFADRFTLFKQPSHEVVHMLADGSLDLVFIDAVRTFEAVSEDIKAWTPKIRQGGIIAGRDYRLPFFGNVLAAQMLLPVRKVLHLAPDGMFWWSV